MSVCKYEHAGQNLAGRSAGSGSGSRYHRQDHEQVVGEFGEMEWSASSRHVHNHGLHSTTTRHRMPSASVGCRRPISSSITSRHHHPSRKTKGALRSALDRWEGLVQSYGARRSTLLASCQGWRLGVRGQTEEEQNLVREWDGSGEGQLRRHPCHHSHSGCKNENGSGSEMRETRNGDWGLVERLVRLAGDDADIEERG